jgi:hypothetical protein
MAPSRSHTLAQAHDQIATQLARSLGNLRLLAIGAPFTEEIVRVIEADLVAALGEARRARTLAGDLRETLGAESER